MAHFETLPENVDLLTSKVTLPDHIKWPYLKLLWKKQLEVSLRACQRHIKDLNSLKLAGCNTDIGIYDLYITDFFLYRWPQVMSFSWPFHYKSMVKNEVPLMRIIRSAQLTQNRNQIGYAWYPRRAVASFPRWKVIWGHIMTSSDRRTFFANNFW